MGFPTAPGTQDHLARLYVDAETFDVLELFHRFKADTLSQPFAQRILYDDYRELASGVRVPFRVRQLQEGLLQLIPEEVRIVRGGDLGIRERQAYSLPIQQRDSALRAVEREKRFLIEGVKEVELRVDSLVLDVTPPGAPAPAPPQ